MKDIKNYDAEKYERDSAKFKKIEEGIYEYICPKCNLSVCIYIENNKNRTDMVKGAE